MMPLKGDQVPAKQWLKSEWQRNSLPLQLANTACGVKDAATRKYFDKGHLWYFSPAEAMSKIAEYANKHGDSKGTPCYSLDGIKPVAGQEWATLRYNWLP